MELQVGRCWLDDTSAIHMTQSPWNAISYEGTYIYAWYRTNCIRITLLAIVHMYQERYSFYTICLH